MPVLISALMIGLAGSFHCAVMCGPLMLTALFNHNNKTSVKKWILYHLGRISTYSLWGMFFGLVGTSLKLFGWQQNISISIGVIMIASVLILKLYPTFETNIAGLYPFRVLKEKLIINQANHADRYLFVKGIFNGILPCGLVYIAMAGAAGMQDPLKGGLFMLFFGIGTLPVLLFVLLVGKTMLKPIRKYGTVFYPYMILFIGLLLIIRGMNLGNMLSPILMKGVTSHVICSPK